MQTDEFWLAAAKRLCKNPAACFQARGFILAMCSARDQKSNAEHFVLLQRFQCRFGHGAHRDSVAKCVEHFDRVAVLAVRRTVMINNLHDITAAESVFGNVASKSSVSIKFKAHGI
jgi:hypothetical protein